MSGIESQVGPAKEASPLERIHDNISKHNTRLSEMLGALTHTMDVMVGSVPSSAPEQGTDVSGSTSISKINDLLEEQGTLLTQLAEQVHRVQEL